MRTLLALPAALAGVLLLAACGSQTAEVRSEGSPQPRPSCAAMEKDGVRITGCDEYQVTNRESEPLTYTITLAWTATTGYGTAPSDWKETVPSVKPGRTVTRTVRADEASPKGLRILQVRSVPTDEAPAAAGPCPPSGVRVTADDGDAAMGLRVVGLHLQNCSRHSYLLGGYPQLQPLGEDHKPVTGVAILHGSGGISTVTGFDDPPRQVTLKPGESASAELMWRNTVTDGTSVNAPYVRVRPKPGARPVMVTPELDLGTTGRLGVSAWKRDPTRR